MAGALAIGVAFHRLVVELRLHLSLAALRLLSRIGGAAIIGGAVTWGVMQAKINSQFDEIAEDQKDQRRQASVAALQAVACGELCHQLHCHRHQRAIGRKAMWTMFQNELQGTMDKLEKTDENLSAIVNKAYIIAAQNE